MPPSMAARTRKRMLTAEQERALLQSWQETSDTRALDRLLRAYEPLCQSLARRFEGVAERGDLLQEARLGLLDAVGRFDPAYGTRLATYATFWIQERLRRYTMETLPLVRIPRNTRQTLSRAVVDAGRDAVRGGAGEQDANRATREVAERYGVSEGVVAMAGQLRNAGHVVSLDAPGASGDGEEAQRPIDILPAEAPSPEQQVAARHDTAVRRAWLRDAVRRLDTRKARIIRRRHMAPTPTTLEALAQEFGVSKERVRQLESAALRDLRRMRPEG